MSIVVPANARGPILDLTLPASEDAIDVVLRNITTGKSLTLKLPEEWDGEDLSLDWRLRTITGATGVDRSALLDPEDNALWAADAFSGTLDLEIEALGGVLLAKDDFNQVAGALTGKNAELGGTYQALAGSDATDFMVDAVNGVALRDASSDTGALGIAEPEIGFQLKGRAVGLPLSVGPCRVQAAVAVAGFPPIGSFGLIARVVDNKNFLAVCGHLAEGELFLSVYVMEKGSGVKKFTYTGAAPEPLGLVLDVVGKRFDLKAGAPGAESSVLTGEHALLSGTLAKGAVYLYHENQGEGEGGVYTFDHLRVYELADAAYAATATLRWEKGYY